jgi:hypothetical protein
MKEPRAQYEALREGRGQIAAQWGGAAPFLLFEVSNMSVSTQLQYRQSLWLTMREATTIYNVSLYLT